MKQIIKTVSFFCIFTILLGCIHFVKAENVKSEYLFDQETLSTIKSFSKDNDNIEINQVINLYDCDNSLNAKCYLLEPKGYAVFNSCNVLVEASFDDDKVFHTIKMSSGEKLYYAGPFNFFKKTNDGFSNIINDKEVSQGTFYLLNKQYDEKSQGTKTKVITSNSIQPQGVKIYYTLPGNMRNYSYNPNGICGATASAMALMYYKDNVDSSLVRPWHDTSTGEELIRLIAPQMHGSLDNPVGATVADVVSGCNFYFRWRGVSNNYSALSSFVSNKSTAFSDMKNIIQSNRPIVLLINSHPTYGDHYITVYEVFQDVGFVDAYYVTARNGWGGTAIVSLNYATGYIYFNR